MKKSFTRRSALALSAGMAATPLIGSVSHAAVAPVLLELFTSQGCSSCPPADRLAAKLLQRDDVVVASLNVDYWDYLGWRDTLAKPEYTQRQYDYARQRGDGQVYTPQMVVNGSLHAVGSNPSDVDNAIKRASRLSSRVSVSLEMNEEEVSISIGSAPDLGTGDVWLMALKPKVEIEIQRGENAGLSHAYHNVVAKLSAAGMWKGASKELSLPRKAVVPNGCTMCVAILQKPQMGEVLGIARHTNTA